VRQLYLLAAAADLAAETGDARLRSACERVWAAMVATKTHITGYLTDRFYIAEDVQGSGSLTLQIDDGRRFEFVVIEGDTNEIIGLDTLHD